MGAGGGSFPCSRNASADAHLSCRATLGHAYYVGFLSAAEVHDAGHQRPQTFQVATSERLSTRTFGRVRVEFVLNTRTSRTRPRR